jgi:hypothetical protein
MNITPTIIASSSRLATTTVAIAGGNAVSNFFNSPLSVSLWDGAIGLILAAGLAAYISLKQWESQKVSENIEKRYLENGLEELIGYLNIIRKESEETFAQSVRVVQHMRDFDKAMFEKWLRSVKPADIRKPSPGMPNSLVRTTAFIKDKLFYYLCIKILLVIDATNDMFTTEFYRMAETELESTDGLFKLKAKSGPEGWAEIMGKLKGELTRRHSQVAPVYGLIESLEVILIRLRTLNPNSYKKFVDEAQNDGEIRQQYVNMKNVLLRDIANSHKIILEYISVLEQKKNPQTQQQLKQFVEQDLAALIPEIERVSSDTSVSDDDIMNLEQKLDEAIIYLRKVLNGFI